MQFYFITKRKYTFEHLMWLHPSFFWIGELQLGHGFELVTSHKQLAASSLPEHDDFKSSKLISEIFCCHSLHWEHLVLNKIHGHALAQYNL